jgi:hypothetical protein
MLKKLTLTDVAARLSLMDSECMNHAMGSTREIRQGARQCGAFFVQIGALQTFQAGISAGTSRGIAGT